MDPVAGSEDGQNRSTEPIYEAAVGCLAIFDEYLRQSKVPEQPSKQDVEQLCSDVEELRARFKQWAVYIGAFAAARASLDARLALQATTREMVLELLILIRLNMRWVIVQNDLKDKDESWKTIRIDPPLTYDAVSEDLVQRRPENKQSFHSKDKYRDMDDPDVPGLGAVKAAIDRLFVLAVDIRRSARESHQIRPGAWNAQSQSLCALLRMRHPCTRPSLLSQLAASIHIRGASLRYLQRHNEKLAFNRNSTIVLSKPEQSLQNATGAANPQANDPAMLSLPMRTLGTSAHVIDTVSTPDTMHSAFSQTNVDRYRARQKRNDSIISRGSVVGVGTTTDEDQYPPIPTGQEKCSICADPLNLSRMTERDWKLHVNQDLEPYLCISEECLDPPKFFSSFTEWMDHMQTRHTMDWAQRIHTERWYCHLCAEVEFDDKAALLAHLQAQHSNKLTASQIQGRARRNRRVAKREDAFACPLCDCVPDSILLHVPEKPYKRLAQHVARHLKSLSFLSLSYLDVDYGRDEESTDHSKTKAVDGGEEGTNASRGSRRDALANESYWDIPETLIVENGTRRLTHALINDLGETVEMFEDDPPPLDYDQYWHFLPPPNLRIDFAALSGFAHSESLKADNASEFTYASKVFLVPERQETPPQPFASIPFCRDPNFIPRGDILDQIDRRCTYPPHRVALVGLGGVGKSQLAIEFAHRTSEGPAGPWVFWVHAGTRARVEESFRMIADSVKLVGRNQPETNIPRLVYNWLSNEKNGRWMLILDSADDDDVFFGTSEVVGEGPPLAAYLPQSRNGSILITSRNRNLATRLTGELGNTIEVGPMTETEALSLLKKKLGPVADTDMDSADVLVRVLDLFPLAISQAAAYIQARAPLYSMKKYIDDFQESKHKQTRLLSHDIVDLRRDGGALNSILTTWQISFEHIRSRRPSAARLLALMSFFDRQGIPKWVLNHARLIRDASDSDHDSRSGLNRDARERTDDDFEEDVMFLESYCLITTNEQKDEFEMDGLVQLSTRKWLEVFKEQDNFRQQFIERMAAAFPTGVYENWTTCQSLFVHIQKALDYQPSVSGWKEWATLLHNGGWYAWSQGWYNTAERMVGKALQTLQKMSGREDLSTLESMSLFAAVIKDQGRWEEAEELDVQVLELRKIRLGPDHPDTLTSMANLASVYWSQGRWEAAEELAVQVLESRKIRLGPDQPDTLTSMANLALVYWSQGRLEAAEELDVQVLESRKKKLGLGHPDTLTSMANLALVCRNQGRYKVAEELAVQVMELRKKSLGPDHPDTLTSIANLALTWKSLGRHDDAFGLMTSCVLDYERVFGQHHPDTRSAKAVLEVWNT